MSPHSPIRLPRADLSCVESIRHRIQLLPPKAEVEPVTLSMYQLVQRLYDDILAFKALGYDAAFICQLLQDESGLPFRPSTLATYLSLEKRRRGGSRKRSRSSSGRSRSRGSAVGNSSPGRSKPGNAEPGLSGPGNADPERSVPGNADPSRSSPGRSSAPGRPSTEALSLCSEEPELEEHELEAQEPLEVDGSMSGEVVVDDDVLRDRADGAIQEQDSAQEGSTSDDSPLTVSGPGEEVSGPGEEDRVIPQGVDPLAYAMRRVDFSFLNSRSQPSTDEPLLVRSTPQLESVAPV